MNPIAIFEDRRQVLAWVHLISGMTLLFFVLLHWLNGCCMMLLTVEANLAAVMLCTFGAMRMGLSLGRAETILMASALVLFSALIFLTSIENTGIYWLAGLPFVVYFVQQVNHARYWVAFFVMELVVAALLQWWGWIETPYSETQLFHIVGVVLFYWVFAHIYQSQLEWRKQQLQESYRALAQQQNRMQVILDHSPIGIWMIDQHRKVQFVNKAWVNICGISEQQARDVDDYSKLLPRAMAKTMLASDALCLAGSDAFYGRDEMASFDGLIRTFDFIKVRLCHEDGEVSGLVAFAIDVTEKLAAETEQKSLEQQVQHAQRLESLGLMAGGIAHDFNNLLTVIQGNIELAKLEENNSESMRESLACVDSATQVATDLCRQMLDYSGKGVTRPEAMNIQQLVEDMLPLLDVSKGKNINLFFDVDAQEPWVLADRGQIRQILLNLVINASEAIGSIKSGNIHVSIAHRHRVEGAKRCFADVQIKAGEYIVLQVKDDGMGMDAKTIERMFDPFFTTKFTGRGLGMSAILGILRVHDAGMHVESKPAKGTTMSVWFPAIDGVEKETLAQPEVRRVMSGRVLLVDDEPGVIHVAGRMLAHLGLTVATAANGREAVELFAQDSDFDWVLLDVTMPEMGGVECLAKLREIRPDIYVAMSSGYEAETALALDHSCQPNDFISKPFNLDRLRSVVEKTTK